MKIITSKQNDIIKKITSLHTTKGRKEHQLFIAEGVRTLEQFSKAEHIPVEIYMTEHMYNSTDNIYPSLHPILVSENVMQKISTLTSAPGVLALFKSSTFIKSISQLDKQTKGVVLNNLQDPGNIGTLIRSAHAFNCNTIIIIESGDILSPKVIQASAGTIASLTIIKCSWEELINYKNRPSLCALVVKNGAINIEQLKKEKPLLIIGNEAHGIALSQSLQCDFNFTIPMNQSTESLNAAIAGSIALFILNN